MTKFLDFNKRKNLATRGKIKGFATGFPHPSSRHEDFCLEIAGWRKRKIITVMAAINGILYGIVSDAGAISRQDGKLQVCHRKVIKLAQYGCGALETSIKGLQVYIRTHWGRAKTFSSLESIREVRDMLHRLGLLKAVEIPKGVCRWSLFLSIDFAGLLAFYELLEDTLLNFWQVPFEELPQHRGGLVKLLYNAANKIMGKRYRRKLPEGVVGIDKWGCKVYARDYVKPEESEELRSGDRTATPVYYHAGKEYDIYEVDVSAMEFEKTKESATLAPEEWERIRGDLTDNLHQSKAIANAFSMTPGDSSF